MCRYAFKTYKSHYVCFDCRKTFKHHPAEDLLLRDGLWEQYGRAYSETNRHRSEEYRRQNPELIQRLDNDYINRKHPCPQCSKEMANLGMDFKAPKVSDVKEWDIIKGMYKLGHAFQTCGCSGPGFIPTNLDEYTGYLTKMMQHYQNMLDSRAGEQSPEDLEQYITYWTGRLKAMTEELNRIKNNIKLRLTTK